MFARCARSQVRGMRHIAFAFALVASAATGCTSTTSLTDPIGLTTPDTGATSRKTSGVIVQCHTGGSGSGIPASVRITPATATITPGQTAHFSATVLDASGAPLSGQLVTWSSSNTLVATSSASGSVTALAVGQATITAASGGKVATAVLIVRASPITTGPGEHAAWSDAFVNSIGTNTHLDYTDRPYVTAFATVVVPRLRELGVRHLRTAMVTLSDDRWMRQYYGRVNTLHEQLGITYDLLTAPATPVVATQALNYGQIPLDRAFQFLEPSAIETVEGLNEMDYPAKHPTWVTATSEWQRALFDSVQHGRFLVGRPVVGPSLSHGASSARAIGNLTSAMTFANMHPYPGGRFPSSSLAYNLHALVAMNGDMPYVATETGYHTAVSATSGQPGVSELAMAKYLPRLFLEYWNAGIARTFSYELMDQGTAPSDPEMHFGMLRYDGSPKPAFTALKVLIGLLTDRGPAFSAGTLAYTITGDTTNVHRALFENRAGRFFLVLWQEVSSFDLVRRADLAVAARSLTVRFPSAVQAVETYRPFASASALSDQRSVASLTVHVPDDALVIAIAP